MNRRGKLGFYKEFLAERDEILRHKDVESEKVGCDVGFERALLDWIEKHRSAWREGRLWGSLQKAAELSGYVSESSSFRLLS